MGSESQSEAVSEHSGDPGEGQGGGKDRPALYALPCGWQGEAQRSCLIAGASEAQRHFPNAQGSQGAQPGGALGLPSVATWSLPGQDGAARAQPPPPVCCIIHESHIPPGINIQKERCKSTFLL